jgi:hypothetical protein
VTLLALMLALVGGHDSRGLREHHAAIVALDASDEERRVLAVVAHAETTYHLASRTPPFGLTERLSRGLPRLDVADSARVALAVLRHHRAACAALGAPSWGAALGRYHHGHRGPSRGCYADTLATIEIRRAGVR